MPSEVTDHDSNVTEHMTKECMRTSNSEIKKRFLAFKRGKKKGDGGDQLSSCGHSEICVKCGVINLPENCLVSLIFVDISYI